MFENGFPRTWSTLRKLLWLKRIVGGAASVVWATVSGTSPLSLVNAVSHAIKSLIQYGKCSQSSTPTPDAPVDIYCNNGALRMVDDELPSGYKRVLGFSCDNNAFWQITGFKLQGSDTVRIGFSVTAACNVFGCYQGADATDNYDLYVSTTAGSKYFRYGNGTYLSYFSNANLGQRFDVVYTPTGSQGMPQDSTWTEATFTSANDLLIGATTLTGSSAKIKGNLYGNIVVDGRLKLIPCERVSDNVLGYYDTYSETFFEPYEGFDGAVSLGYDGSHYSMEVVGTPEVLTVSGANLFNAAAVVDDGKYINSNNGSTGTPSASGGTFVHSGFIPVTDGKTLFFGQTSYRATNAGLAFYSDVDFDAGTFTYLEGKSCTWMSNNDMTVTVPNGAKYMRFAIRTDEDYDTNWQNTVYLCEVVDGTPLLSAYQPYVTPQTVNDVPMLLSVGDYKDEAEIISGLLTHKVGIIVLDGTETWYAGTATGVYQLPVDTIDGITYKDTACLCTHFKGLEPKTSAANMTDLSCKCGHNNVSNKTKLYIRYNDMADADALKAYLSAQYAAGTPVIVIYPLAEETTETVTGQSLSTTAGDNVVSVVSNVDPVELTVEYATT